MKKILFIVLFCVSFSSAEINEYVSDVYFANGIDTDDDDAQKSLEYIDLELSITYPEAYKSVTKWAVSPNHTRGMGIDLYESMLQKIDEDWRIGFALNVSGLLKFTYGGIVKELARGAAKETIEVFTQKQAEKIARKIFVYYRPGNGTLDGYTQAAVELLFQKVFSKIIDDLIMQVINIPEEDIKRKEQADIQTQFTAYTQSIKDGHGVVVIAHSQGNLFTNVVYDMFTNHWLPWDEDTEWMRRYFSAFAVASPANDILGQSEPHITFDNDIINIVPNNLNWNITNPTRYYVEDAIEINGTKIDNKFSFEAHAFLTSYMKEDITREHILGFIRNRVDEQKYNIILRPSQWITDQELEKNTCDYKITVKHQYDPSIEMGATVYPFNASKKLYQVNGEYVKASCGGENILGEGHDIVTWDGKKDNECLMIDNVEEETIAADKLVSFNTYMICHVVASAGENFPGYMLNKGFAELRCYPRGDNPFISSDINIRYNISEEGSTNHSINSELQHALVEKHFGQMNDKMNSYFTKMISDAKAKYGIEHVKTKLVGPAVSCPKPSRYNGITVCTRYNVYQWVFINQDPW